MNRVFALTFARGGSKGVPKKNIRPLGGKPLIAWALDTSKQVVGIVEHYVSTDDADIANVAVEWGGVVIERPCELATDEASEWLAWQHAATYLIEQGIAEPSDIFLSLPATSPLRRADDIKRALEQFGNNRFDILVTGTESQRSPYFNMLKQTAGDGYELVLSSSVHRRQDAPVCYDMTTVCYITTFAFVMSAEGVLDGAVDLYCVDKESALDIDTEADFRLGEFLISDGYENNR